MGNHILVVDDETTLLNVLRRVLEKAGHEVATATSAETALQQFVNEPCPLVITDIVMGNMNGIELLRKIKKLSPDTMVVVMTSHASLDTATEALRAGAYDYLIKPFDEVRLISNTANRALERYQLIQHNRTLMDDLTRSNEALAVAGARAQEANAAAKRTSLLTTRYLDKFSTDIRRPMNRIVATTSLLRDTKLDVQQRQYLDTIRDDAESLLGLINGVLDFTKIEAGKLALESIPFSFRDCVREGIPSAALAAEQKGLKFSCEIAHTTRDRLIGDPGRLRQILATLAGNAVRYTSEGEVTVRASSEPEGVGAVSTFIEVADTGPGVPEDRLDTIFDGALEPSLAAPSNSGSSGLGLAISKRLVEMMDGDIWVERNDERGSVFRFTARLGLGTDGNERPEPVSVEALSGVRVLVVDDAARSCEFVVDSLERLRMSPTVVTGKDAAIETLRGAGGEDAFPLMIASDHEPDADAFALIEQLRKGRDAPSTRVTILTSTGIHGDGSRCRELGVAAYLPKPVLPEDLQVAIRTVLGSPAGCEDGELVTRHTLRSDRLARGDAAEEGETGELEQAAG